MKLLFAAGGTGGHLRPAVATADAVTRVEPAAKVVFLTSGRPIDDRFLGGRYEQRPLFPGGRAAPSKRDLPGWWRAYGRARGVVRDLAPDVVAGFGGYPTALAGVAALGSPLLAAWRLLLRRPVRGPGLVLLEQNAHAGRAVRLLAPVASRVLLSLEDARSGLPPRRCEVTGNPLPRELAAPDADVDAGRFGLDEDRVTVVSLGGSQGARGVNRLVLAARAALAGRDPAPQLLMLTGDVDADEVRERLEREPAPPTVAIPFEGRMRDVYELADVVVARAGGTTLAELAVVGRPLVLVPYPHHKDQHQLKNARVFERAGAARIVEEGPDAERAMVEALRAWLDDDEARASAAEAARGLARPDAAERCARAILAVAAAGSTR